MFKKTLALITLSLAALAVPSLAHAGPGHYETRVVVVREWVPAQNTRVKVRVWVPARVEYLTQTHIVRQSYTSYDRFGRCITHPAVTRTVRVPRHIPGFYRYEWRVKTVPGYYRNVKRHQRVFVPYRGRRVVVKTPRVTTRSIERQVSRTNRRVNKEARRSARKTGREARRLGRRINKEIKRIFD